MPANSSGTNRDPNAAAAFRVLVLASERAELSLPCLLAASAAVVPTSAIGATTAPSAAAIPPSATPIEARLAPSAPAPIAAAPAAVPKPVTPAVAGPALTPILVKAREVWSSSLSNSFTSRLVPLTEAPNASSFPIALPVLMPRSVLPMLLSLSSVDSTFRWTDLSEDLRLVALPPIRTSRPCVVPPPKTDAISRHLMSDSPGAITGERDYSFLLFNVCVRVFSHTCAILSIFFFIFQAKLRMCRLMLAVFEVSGFRMNELLRRL